jgi:hypothetical protein
MASSTARWTAQPATPNTVAATSGHAHNCRRKNRAAARTAVDDATRDSPPVNRPTPVRRAGSGDGSVGAGGITASRVGRRPGYARVSER